MISSIYINTAGLFLFQNSRSLLCHKHLVSLWKQT